MNQNSLEATTLPAAEAQSATPGLQQICKDRRSSAMIQSTQQDILTQSGPLCELSPGVRFGQLLANLGFLAEDMPDCTLWDIEDAELLQVIERHRADLS